MLTEESLTWVGETKRSGSPLGKVPCPQTEHGPHDATSRPMSGRRHESLSCRG